MSKVKICGLYRKEDITYINKYNPEYCGFIINFKKSHRNVDIHTLKELSTLVNPNINKVGVFVNEDEDVVISLLNENIIDIAQLHGNEDEEYIQYIKDHTNKEVIKFFKINDKNDILNANQSKADYVLLDSGTGSGKTFDWDLLKDINRPYFLAGGININNVKDALKLNPMVIDISSGVETNKLKDENKIREIIKVIREE